MVEGYTEEFECLKPFIAFIAQNLCELDNTVQKFNGLRSGLPNAQFLAFTSTPLLGTKRLTNAWFGDYVSEYNFAESIKDNATVPLYYVKRVPEVELQNDFLDSDFAEIL